MLTHGSLFSGIGGIDLGFERAGIKTIWQVEIDEFARKVLGEHWTLSRHKGLQPGIISGGFPCQDISIAGKRKGIKGERSGLWYEMLVSICLLRPKYVLVENVSEICRNGLLEVLRGFAQEGYNAEWFTLSASDVGAPHKRERTFIVAFSNEIGWHDGIFNHKENDIQENEEWDISENIKSGLQWERWLIQNSQADNGEISKADFSGVDDGVPKGMDRSRIECLGNAVVPQVAEFIGRRIMEFDNELSEPKKGEVKG